MSGKERLYNLPDDGGEFDQPEAKLIVPVDLAGSQFLLAQASHVHDTADRCIKNRYGPPCSI